MPCQGLQFLCLCVNSFTCGLFITPNNNNWRTVLQLQTAAPHGLQNLIKTTLSLGTADQVLQSDLCSPIRGKPYPMWWNVTQNTSPPFHTSGFLLGGHLPPLSFCFPPWFWLAPPWFWLAPPWFWLALPWFWLAPLGYAEISILHAIYSSIYKSFNDTINCELCLCKKSPRFHQIVSTKRSKIKNFPRGECLQTPLVCSMLCTQIHTCPPPNNPYNLIWHPLRQKARESEHRLQTTLLLLITALFEPWQ